MAQPPVKTAPANALKRNGANALPAALRGSIALSVRQPYAEQIMRGMKKFEFRAMPTYKRGRVVIYASLKPGDPAEFKKLKVEPGDLPTGVIVGSVEITDCLGEPGDYRWKLERPRRIKRLVAPKQQPQPAWFYPFR